MEVAGTGENETHQKIDGTPNALTDADNVLGGTQSQQWQPADCDKDHPELSKCIDQLNKSHQQILSLLKHRFDCGPDIRSLAKSLWHIDDGGINGPRAQETERIGWSFLRSLAPCGSSLALNTELSITDLITSPRRGRAWTRQHNLTTSYRAFEDWARRPHGFSSPWDGHIAADSNAKNQWLIKIQTRWPNVWNMWYQGWQPSGILKNKTQVIYSYADTFENPHTYQTELSEYINVIPTKPERDMCGIICRFWINRSPGIVDVDTIANILCFTKGSLQGLRGNSHEFLHGHIAKWRERSVEERFGLRKLTTEQHTSSGDHIQGCDEKGWDEDENMTQSPLISDYAVFFHYMRSFTVCDLDMESSASEENLAFGLGCKRERITLQAFSGHETLRLVEKRYSTTLSLLPVHRPSGTYTLVSVIDDDTDLNFSSQARRNIWEGAPGETFKNDLPFSSWHHYGIHPAGLFTGVSMLQLQICSFVDTWDKDWNQTLDQVDRMVSVEFDELENDEFLQNLVLDSDSRRSVLYFKVLQILRIFSDSLISDSCSLEMLQDNCWGSTNQNGRLQMLHTISDETRIVLKDNWAIVRERHRAVTDRLLSRIARTTEEIKSLRDGLFNAQSVAEAQKNRQLSKYLIVFTVVTLLYLPPTFVATFFGSDIFIAPDVAHTRKLFWTVFGAVTGLTYIMAAIGLSGASVSPQNRRKVAEWCGSWIMGSRQRGPAQTFGTMDGVDRGVRSDEPQDWHHSQYGRGRRKAANVSSRESFTLNIADS